MPDVESLFQSYKNDVYRLALSYTRSVTDAEDVTQTVFLKAMEQKHIVPGKERAWLMQVAANECRSLLRSGWWKKTAPLEECTAAAPEGSGILRELLALEPKYRVVLYLYYYTGAPTAEIGSLLHITQSTVTTRLSRGRLLLKERLKEEIV